MRTDSPVVIVGAGAAGLATAIFACRASAARGANLDVTALDSAKRPGAKILVSGGGRCNVTNTIVTERDFWGGRSTFVRRVLRAFPVDETIAFFRDEGVSLHEEPGGKLFPDTNRARDVLDALLRASAGAGVTLVSGDRVLDVARFGDGFRLTTSAGDRHASRVVLATGGQSLPKSGSDGAGYAIARRLGHTIVDTTPALVPLLVDPSDSRHRDLSGVSQPAEIAVWVDGAIATRIGGAMLWTHFGLSGPAALDASRHWLRAQTDNRSASLTVSFCPGQSFDAVDREWTNRAREQPRTSLQHALSTTVPSSVAAALLRALAIDGGLALAHLSREDRRRVVHAIVAWPIAVTGTRGYNFAEATAGGVSLDEVDPATMESRVCRGLYLVGEILDVDGRIGGFNFQWAWSSAFVAGRALAGGAART